MVSAAYSDHLKGFVEMTNAEYHGGPGVSKSHLDVAARSLALYKHKYIDKAEPFKPTPALVLGSAVHCAVLEPDLFMGQFACAPEVDRRTKAGKAEYEAFVAEVGDKTVLTSAQWDTALNIRDVLQKHTAVRKLLAAMPCGKAEQTVFATDPETGEQVKCRFDFVDFGTELAVDLKTTRDASPAGFTRSVMGYRYHVQEAWYRYVLGNGMGLSLGRWTFLAVETEPPYLVGLYTLDLEAWRAGARLAMQNLRAIHHAKQAGEFPDYAAEGPQELVLPAYATPADADDDFEGLE